MASGKSESNRFREVQKPDDEEIRVDFHYGIVAILDALGAQSISEADARSFITCREVCISEASMRVLELDTKEPEADSKVKLTMSSVPSTHTFGDTLIAVWPVPAGPNNVEPSAILPSVGIWLSAVVAKALSYSVFFRGAVSFGRYYQDENTILGEAVADAASWHEQADWYGVIATPTLYYRLEHLDCVYKNEHDSGMGLVEIGRWTRTEVPLKGAGRTIETYAVDWPSEFITLKGVEGIQYYYWLLGSSRQVDLISDLRLSIPPGTEQKYENSERFFRRRREQVDQRKVESLDSWGGSIFDFKPKNDSK